MIEDEYVKIWREPEVLLRAALLSYVRWHVRQLKDKNNWFGIIRLDNRNPGPAIKLSYGADYRQDFWKDKFVETPFGRFVFYIDIQNLEIAKSLIICDSFDEVTVIEKSDL